MDNEEKEQTENGKQENGHAVAQERPFCTTAPSAEHSRAYHTDEPCDDSTAGSGD